jgi:tRNA(Arg) A34 adenosine deaminase TadA
MQSTTETQWMIRANELATESVRKGTGPFGCVILSSDGELIAEGNNRVTELNDPTAHAEIVAIRRACDELKTFDLSGCQLYSSCEPCPMCLSAIYWSRIQHVYYGNTRQDAAKIGFDDEFIYDELNKDMENRSVHLKRVRSYNESESFDLWFRNPDKVIY